MIRSDWHMHSECSFDSTLTFSELLQKTSEYGFAKIGITDHVNFNDANFLGDLERSAAAVRALQADRPHIVLGVELTPIEQPEFDYIAKHGTREGYVAPRLDRPFPITLALTKEELMARGVRYAVGATHWRVDVPNAKQLPTDLPALIREWFRQQMWLACDERVTILGHPWYHGKGVWYHDFSLIPHSMNMELAAALKEHGKFVECNAKLLCSPMASEKFRHQYAEFLRELFEFGIPITYGSDSHHHYSTAHKTVETYLAAVGFTDGDFSDLTEEHLW